MKQPKEFGIIKEMQKEMKDLKRRLKEVEKAVQIEKLTKGDLIEITKSEAEIKAGKYRTLEQTKKELGI